MKITIESCKKETFKKYGQLVCLPPKDMPTIATDNVVFWKQQVITSFGTIIEVGVLRVKKQEMVFDELENHFNTPTGLICLDSDFVVAVGTPSDDLPLVKNLQVFRITKGELVILEAKCWHSSSFPIDREEVKLLVFFRKDTLNNDAIYEKLDEHCELIF